MEWIADPESAGGWLRERLDAGHGTMHGVVPHGYPAYARVFHPAGARTMHGGPLPSPDDWVRMPAAEQERRMAQIEDAPATWAETAAAFGTEFHPLAQWHRLVRSPPGWIAQTRVAPDGREFTAPQEGVLPPDLLARLAAHLVAHTSTPDDGVAAVWEGWGGLLGFFGESPSRAFLGTSADPNHQAMLDRSVRDPFNNVFRRPVWQDGILSREISEGPRLQLPDRGHVLFSAPPRAFAEPHWILAAPWRDRVAEEHGFAPDAQHPSILWPSDRTWVMVSEIDSDSTVVAGPRDLVAAICADDVLEALPIPEGADLSRHGDRRNPAEGDDER